jgi:hypothetical protein
MIILTADYFQLLEVNFCSNDKIYRQSGKNETAEFIDY